MRLTGILKKAGIFLAFMFLVGISSGFAQDKVIAIVNNDIITQKDLNDFTNFMRIQLSADYKGQQLENKIQSMKLDLLDKLIEDRLILQEAKNMKMVVDEARIKARIDEIKNKIGSDAEFEKSLKQQGLVQADLENRIREQILMYGVIDYKIKSKIIVYPSEVTDFYDKHKAEFKSHEEREIQSIAVEDGVSANQIYDKLKKGGSSEEVAKDYKARIDKFNIGNGEELKKEIESAIFNLNINEISKPVKIEDKFYIFKVSKIIPAQQEGLDEAKETIQNYLFDKKMQEALGKWLNEIKKQSYIQILPN